MLEFKIGPYGGLTTWGTTTMVAGLWVNPAILTPVNNGIISRGVK
jgi:hypothetical protein